jgi:purine-cytosine permease-like protein
MPPLRLPYYIGRSGKKKREGFPSLFLARHPSFFVWSGLPAVFAKLLVFQLPFYLFLVFGSEVIGILADLALHPKQIIL